MKRQHSIRFELIAGFAAIGVMGTLSLLVTVLIDYHRLFSALDRRAAFARSLHEMFDHVALPIMVLMIPAALATLWVIRRALKPLSNATLDIEANRGNERGYRLDATRFPQEVQPFIEAINNLLQRLDDAAELHRAFAADVAHELRTPLAVLALELDGMADERVDRLKADVTGMRRLIGQLMLMAQIEGNRVANIPATPVRLADVCADVAEMLAPEAIAGGKAMALEVQAADATVEGHREAILAALRNLAENALRVTPAGQSVTILCGPGHQLRVRDAGPGMSAGQLDQLVKRHVRADHASAGGAGLGLAIADRIMQLHHGRLAADPAARELALHFP